MAVSSPTTITEVIWWGFSLAVSFGVVEILRRLTRIEKYQRDQLICHSDCQKEITKELEKKVDWDEFHKHTHEAHNGKVIR